MKIRVGLGLGAATDLADGATLGHIVDELERLSFDSLWFTERINGPSLDPLVAMTFTIARTRKLKVGTAVMVLPGRNPVVLAKALASLDRLSNGREIGRASCRERGLTRAETDLINRKQDDT